MLRDIKKQLYDVAVNTFNVHVHDNMNKKTSMALTERVARKNPFSQKEYEA